MTSSDAASLKSLANELCEALQGYVAVLTIGTEPENVLPAMDVLQAAADKFVQLSITETGWGNPFLPSRFDDDEFDVVPLDEDESDTVEVTVNYSIRCLDRQAARQVVDERLHQAGIVGTPEDEIDTITGILMTLESIDGWNPQLYQVRSQGPFEVLEKSWSFT